MLLKRIITALTLGPIFFGTIWFGGSVLFFLLSILLGTAFWAEFLGVIDPDSLELKFFGKILYVLLGFLPLVIWVTSGIFQDYLNWAYWYALCAFILAIMTTDLRAAFNKASSYFLGLNYVGLFLFSFISIRSMEKGREYIVFLLITVFAGDILAYFVGKSLGTHKLAPRVSPKKTWEGAIGGLLGSIFAGTLFMYYFNPEDFTLFTVFLAGLIGVIAQMGDLFESILKRSFGIKDSGRLLPGHGGFLDRFDGVIFSAPLLYSVLRIF
ncbi:Phosphatidate cytidylyltransferase [Dissulfuribacter thermophilus]|uniref:Phosphatidate cytidylyltransferase n=1 Tax=Dissulfuribacter thermophilus TaxID=1156395 RepID=A0A1B9F8E2_9BACT|nr:phosphatidate cytidylyltransferase [Dissulfuribacter thermophilus]OCC16041.1 Phosphatidate cytidylyltransferase [Dissulfuribacter thermophilus]